MEKVGTGKETSQLASLYYRQTHRGIGMAGALLKLKSCCVYVHHKDARTEITDL